MGAKLIKKYGMCKQVVQNAKKVVFLVLLSTRYPLVEAMLNAR